MGHPDNTDGNENTPSIPSPGDSPAQDHAAQPELPLQRDSTDRPARWQLTRRAPATEPPAPLSSTLMAVQTMLVALAGVYTTTSNLPITVVAAVLTVIMIVLLQHR